MSITVQESIKVLKKIPLFGNLSDTELAIIVPLLTEKVYSAGEVLIVQDDLTDNAYIICSGVVRVYRLSEEGEEINIAIIGAGEIVGELSLLDDKPRSAYVETIQETKALVFSKHEFLSLLTEHPLIAVNLLKALATRIRENSSRLESLISKSLTERSLLTIQTLAPYFPNGDVTLSQEELAQIVGATRARVTETLNQLQSEGKIYLSHRKIHLT